ncbi:MAG TPA: T9SS type A sorting domain-containing protein, partial [Bacteroidia bacterium]|nr:T9SS type A sorting domain-containing protein [Bacteroidia bacterium]
WDSPMIWNDFLTNNGVNNNNPFGIAYDLANFSETTTNIANLPSDSCLHGPMGNVAEAQWSNGTSMTISPTANPAVTGVVYMTASTKGGNTGVMFAHSTYGKGKVAAMGDSSPPDDGTGNPSCTLYTGYFGDAAGNHQLLLMNATIWLVTKSSAATGISEANTIASDITFFPNPCQETGNIRFRLEAPDHLRISITDMLGREVIVVADENRTSGENGFSFSTDNLPAGLYTYRIAGTTGASVGKFMVSAH